MIWRYYRLRQRLARMARTYSVYHDAIGLPWYSALRLTLITEWYGLS